jgi:large subunit ribosomal protein L13
MPTFSAKPAEVEKKWVLIDATGLVVGRLATIVAMRLRGKHKASYTPHVDDGDNVIIINAAKAVLTGRKREQKIYYHHTGYIGGIKSIALEKLLAEHPERVIEIAVKGMLPKNPLGRAMFRKLHVFAGTEHPHQAQQPKPLEIQ